MDGCGSLDQRKNIGCLTISSGSRALISLYQQEATARNGCYDSESPWGDFAITKSQQMQAFRDFDLLGPPDSYVCLDLRISGNQRRQKKRTVWGMGRCCRVATFCGPTHVLFSDLSQVPVCILLLRCWNCWGIGWQSLASQKTHGAFNGLSLSTKMDNWHQLATLRIPPVIKQHRNGRIINKWQNPLPCIAMTDYQREGCLIPSNVVIIAHLHYANKTCAGGHQILPWRTYLILVCEDSCSITNYLVRTSSLYKPNEHEYNLCLWHLVLSDYLQWDINFSINCWSTTWHIINKNTDDWPSPCFALLEHNFHWLSLDITRRSLNR